MRAFTRSTLTAFIALGALVALTVGLAGCSLQIEDNDFVLAVDADTSDAPAAAIEIIPALLDLVEGETDALTVRANTPLDADVTVTLAADVTVGLSVASVVLGPGQSMATFSVTALDDDDAQPGNATVSAQAPGLGVATSQVAIAEDDTLSLAADQNMVTITETTSTMVRVRLTARPPGDVTVTVSSGDTQIASVAPASLFFDADNWNLYQPVTVAGGHDPDAENDTIGVTFTATDLPSLVVSATVNDVDRLAIETSTGSVTITEQATAGTIGVRLTQQPATTVMVTAAPGSAGVQVSPSSLTFTPTDYANFKTLNVSALMDDNTDGFTTTVNLSATDVAISQLPFTVIVNDDDMQTITTNAPSPLVVAENATVMFGARLAYRPGSDVVVGVSTMSAQVATVTPGALTFTTTNWDQLQPVTVTGVDDDDVVTSSTAIRLQAGALIRDVTTNVTDPDVQDLQLINPPATVPEGSTASFTVRLAFRPQASTTVTIGSNDPAIAVTTPSLTFVPASYATPQMVTLSAPTDIDVIEESATITVASAPLPSKTFTATVSEASVVSILTSVPSVMVTEQATGVPFNVTLSNPPSGTMTVSVAPNNPGISVSPTQLTFNAGDYNSPKAITVSGLLDDDVADLSGMVTLTATGATTANVSVMVDDDDVQAILETAPTTIDVIDPDGTAPVGVTFGVHLAFRPAASTTVTVTSLATGVATATPGTLTFTTSDWNVDKMVTVTAAGDVNLANGSTTVRLTSSPIPMADVPVAVDDQDVQVVETSPSTLMFTEGTSTTLMVRLKYQPATGTTVTLASNNSDVTVPATMSFTTGNYGNYQNATVGAMADTDQSNDTATVTLGNFDAPSNTLVPVTVTDNTIIETFGWPTYFGANANLGAGTAYAYQITIPTTTTLDFFGAIAGAGGTDARMALYTNAGGTPGMFVAEAQGSLAAGTATFDTANIQLTGGTSYWIAVRFSATASIGAAAGPRTRCSRTMATYANPWPATFGTATCSSTSELNIFISTFR